MLPQNMDVPISFTVAGTPASASFRVRGPDVTINADGTIQDWTVINLAAQTTPGLIVLTIPAALNVITTFINITNAEGVSTSSPALREARVIDLLCVLPGLPATITSLDYQIGANDQLVIMQNTFQLYANASEFASEIPGLDSWPSANIDQRTNALMAAFQRLSRLNYEIYYDRDDVYFRNRASYGLPYINTIGRLYNYTATDFLALDPDFVMKISRAQVIEADDILGGDPVLKERESGILSVTNGQSKHTYRPGKPLRMAICRRTMDELSGYIKHNVRLIRS